MKHFVRFISLFLCLTSFGGSQTFFESGFADIVEPLMPAVVNVYTVYLPQKSENNMRNQFDKMFPDGSPFEQFNDFFEHFGMKDFDGGTARKTTALGSGFIIDAKGYVVTNHHVIKDADEISVKTYDNKEYKAKLVGSDSKTDLALLKVESDSPLPYVNFGNSDDSRVGDWVIAIGNPFGLGGTVTAGIVSSKGRDIELNTDSIVDNLIQTDAAINRGNSGGPMFNTKKEVIGVNTAIYSTSGGSVGIGFAIPSNTAANVIAQLKEGGKVLRGKLKVSIQDITEEISESLGMKEAYGALVLNVETGGPGDKAGLKPGDVVVEYNSTKVSNSKKLQKLVAETKAGQRVTLKVLRQGKEVNLSTILIAFDSDALKSESQDGQKVSKNEQIIGGISLSDLDDRMRERFGIADNVRGVVVTGIAKNSSFINSRIMKGDVIISLNQQSVSSVRDFAKLYEQAKARKKKNILLMIQRKDMNLFLAAPMK
jgi:serine protease Do